MVLFFPFPGSFLVLMLGEPLFRSVVLPDEDINHYEVKYQEVRVEDNI